MVALIEEVKMGYKKFKILIKNFLEQKFLSFFKKVFKKKKKKIQRFLLQNVKVITELLHFKIMKLMYLPFCKDNNLLKMLLT